ncbi:MAG TPA: YidC/Oxa1 family membrane protein insertase [Solirubrobacteraceae bacterium]|jgi:YidC/Oxa1 family membrane protein insertase|nr:YidC/Oxa1 family membrane protein insertase [Solirubrobacteraceae bacterium]
MLLVTANIFQPLIDVFEAVLKFFHNSIGIPWGWAIVLLTICVRAILVPLTVRQIRSMARMQQLAPEMKAIQARYKEDKQRQQQEMMKFYKENNVNPLSSCLPLAAQLPVFISLYYMLRQSLRVDICPSWQRANDHGVLTAAHTVACGSHGQSSFLFIGDITDKAAGATLVVLILLYVGTQLGSSLMMSGAMTDRTQRQIMLFMPLLFVIFVIRFPAGVLVYWITTNLWTIGQQYVVKRRIGPLRPATPGGSPPAGGSGGGGRSDGGGPPKSGPNGSGGSGGGLGALIRKPKEPVAEKQPVAAGARGGAPPKSPRKKKKRSGRRR